MNHGIGQKRFFSELKSGEFAFPTTVGWGGATRRISKPLKIVLVSLVCLAYTILFNRPRFLCPGRHHHHKLHDDKTMTFGAIGELVQQPCWHDLEIKNSAYECYRMAAPLDHKNLSDPRRASIAVAKYPAGGGKTTAKEILGTVFLNPGGPGGSGLKFVTAVNPARGNITGGEYFDRIFKGRYNIMSFDPRAVGHTVPRARCFADDEAAYVNELFWQGGGLPHSSDHAIIKALAHNKVVAGICEQQMGEELRFVTTTSVVKDLVLMLKAVGDKKLNYAGFSYGTVLGSYFADIYPEQVGKFWLDGVVDVPNYQSGMWSDNLADFEKVRRGFFTTCAEAGVDGCALVSQLKPQQTHSQDKGALALHKLFDDLLESLKEAPVPVINASLPGVVSYSYLKTAFFQAAYSPQLWPQFAEQINDALSGNWVPFANAHGMQKFRKGGGGAFYNNQAQPSIACSDSLYFGQNWGKAEYQAALREMEKISPFAAELWIDAGAQCLATWKIRGKDIWRGNFSSSPANPILFGSNSFDPVTPLGAARLMRGSFGGRNRLVHVKGAYGHCTIASPSKCALAVVSDWFINDKLPVEEEKICESERLPFSPSDAMDNADELAHGLSDVMAEWQQRSFNC